MVGDKYGFMDYKGNIIIDPLFDYANILFSEGLCFVKIGNRRGFIDTTGNLCLELADSIDNATDFVKGLSIVECKYHKGCINNTGAFVIRPNNLRVNININTDNDNVFIVVENYHDSATHSHELSDWFGEYLARRKGIINEKQKIIINHDWFITDINGDTIGGTYDSILVGFSNGLCAVKKNNKWGYIDINGRLVIDTIYDFARMFTGNGVARVRKDNKHYFIDKTGDIIIEADSTICGFNCNRAAVVLNGEKCLIDIKGNKICSLDAEEFFGFSDDDCLATIIKNNKAAKIDTMGNIVLNTEYENIGAFINEIAPVKKNGKWGFIDTTGTEIITVSYDGYDEVIRNNRYRIRAVVNKINDQFSYSYYDLTGNLIWQDIPPAKKFNPVKASSMTKEDFIEYFNTNIASLDPIEGVYYVTHSRIYQDRENPSIIGSNGSTSIYRAIIRNKDIFTIYNIGNDNGYCSTFISKIGESNNYAVCNPYGDEYNDRFLLENPSKFEYKFRTSTNNWYNFYSIYEYLKDFPPASKYEQATQPEWSGTGFAIADGLIATNYHVVNGAKKIRIKGVDGEMGTAYNGYVIASEKEYDIAIIKIVDKKFKGFGKIPYCVGKSISDVGENVFALGYPLTTTMGNEIKLTNGIISSTSGFQGDVSMYQISVPLQPGNSGGPLFDDDGNVIGIVTAKHADAENANYAVKVNYLASLISNKNLDIKLADNNKIKNKSLKKKVKAVKNFVYLIECSN